MSINIKDVLKKYTMVFALIAVVIFFQVMTGGKMLLPQNLNNLISQNAYVFVLAAGMLLCILTGGNIDLACGSVVCFLGGIGAVVMAKDINWVVAVLIMLARYSGGCMAGLLDSICEGTSLHRYPCRHVRLQRTRQCCAPGIFGRYRRYGIPECVRRRR